MSSFTDPLIARIEQGEDGGRGEATVWRRFRYEVGAVGSGDVVSIPSGPVNGFVTDFASIPRILMPIFPVTGKAAKAAVVHDFLLREGKRPRRECDAIFLEAMAVLRVPPLRRYLMWAGVRVWGILRQWALEAGWIRPKKAP